MRFNPPPNWPPAPADWTPPPGWQPDASWPPVPPDWQLWVDDEPAPPRRKTPLIVGGLAAVLLVVGGAVIAVAATRDSSAVSATAPSTSTSAKSDEDQIKAAVKGFQDAWNNEDFSAFTPIVCKDMRAAKEFNESDFLAARQDADELNFSIQTIQVNGSTATATIKPDNGRTRTVPFVRESDGWKWCDP